MAVTVAAGSKLGRYEIVKHLTSGGMADLLLARAGGLEGFERHVVIKRIRGEQEDDQSFVEMFLHEARLAGSLHHHNIVQVYDIGEANGKPYFAMEYVHGEDLRTLLCRLVERKEQLPLQHLVTIVSAIAIALHHAHEQKGADRKPLGIVHRDVTPANVLVGYDGNVKVVDFGIARAAARRTETQAGMLRGKAPYMSPEQCVGGTIDRRSDVFALGTVLYELATARRLFKGDNEFVTMSTIVKGAIPKPSSIRKDIPAELDAIIVRALARDPGARFQTAEQLYNALEELAVKRGLRTSSTALSTYMKQLFGERPEPWIGEYKAPSSAVDFDGTAPAIAVPPSDAEASALPKLVKMSATSPIARARESLAHASKVISAAGSSPALRVPEAAAPQAASARTKSAPMPAATAARLKPKSVQVSAAKFDHSDDEEVATAVVSGGRELADLADGAHSTAVVADPLAMAAAVENAHQTAVLPVQAVAGGAAPAKATPAKPTTPAKGTPEKGTQAPAPKRPLPAAANGASPAPRATAIGTAAPVPARPIVATPKPAPPPPLTEDSVTDVDPVSDEGLELLPPGTDTPSKLPSWSTMGKGAVNAPTLSGRPLPKLVESDAKKPEAKAAKDDDADDPADAATAVEPGEPPVAAKPVAVKPVAATPAAVAKPPAPKPVPPARVVTATDVDEADTKDLSDEDITEATSESGVVKALDESTAVNPVPPLRPPTKKEDPTAIVKPLPSPPGHTTDQLLAEGTRPSTPAPSRKNWLLIGGGVGAVLFAVIAYVIGTSGRDATEHVVEDEPARPVVAANNGAPEPEPPRQPRTWANSEKPAGVEEAKPVPTPVPTEPTPEVVKDEVKDVPTEVVAKATDEVKHDPLEVPANAKDEIEIEPAKVAVEEKPPVDEVPAKPPVAKKLVKAPAKPVTAVKKPVKKPPVKVAAKKPVKKPKPKTVAKAPKPAVKPAPAAKPVWDPNALFPKK